VNTGEIPGNANKKWRNLLHFAASGVEEESHSGVNRIPRLFKQFQK